MNVKRILSRKGQRVLTVAPTDTLAVAVKLFASRRIGALVVMAADGEIAGIISERDVVRALDKKGNAALVWPIADFMTREIISCSETATDLEILKAMTDGGFRHVPVVEQDHLVGIVSIGDVVKVRLEEVESKLISLEGVTASIAHEVRQPLGAIGMNASAALRFLRRTPPDHDEVCAALNRIISDSHRTSDVFESIRALFRNAGASRKQLLDVNGIVNEAVRSLETELQHHDVTLKLDLARKLPLIEVDKGQLQQVMYNLARNAVEAMSMTKDRMRMLHIRTKRHGRDGLEVSFEDSGPGIAPEQMEGIFDPFVTTRASGIGLGLAFSRLIIERHGGALSASSEMNHGAVFRIFLPTRRLGRTNTVRAIETSAGF